MFRHWSLIAIIVSVSTMGCGDASAPRIDTAVTAEPGGAPLAALTAEDLVLIQKQKKCPVGGPLGGMGTPVKMMVGDRAIFLCCEHCREAVEKDPAKYLAKLDAQAAAPDEPEVGAAMDPGTPAEPAPESPSGPAPEGPATPVETPAKP